ncbi:MAG: hypothetical protein QM734_00330 [Cyclobacteriaceae bacterium]
MKKSTVLLVLAIAAFASACTVNTCPTYSKAPNKPMKENRI